MRLRTVQTTFVVALLIPAALCVVGCGGSAATVGKDVAAEQRADAVADRGALDAGGDAAADGRVPVDSHSGTDSRADVKPDLAADAALDVKAETADEIADEPPCVPDCGGKECGEDGCGGTCGECGNGVDIAGYCLKGLCQEEAVQCDDGNACTLDTVEGCRCVHAAAGPGCCLSDPDCEDGDPCTKNLCIDFHCELMLLDEVNQDCLEWCDPGGGLKPCHDKDPCTLAWCDAAEKRCKYAKMTVDEQIVAGIECCAEDADCQAGGAWEEDGDGDGKPGPDLSGTIDLCINGLCSHVANPGGCDCGPGLPECAEDDNACSQDVCLAGCVCAHLMGPGCCTTAEDCKDGTTFTSEACNLGFCSYWQKLDDHCDTPWKGVCWDDNDCTGDACGPGGESDCYHLPYVNNEQCCIADGDCGDCDPCTQDTCVDFECVHAPAAGCPGPSSD